jgi:hypothetical protein
MTSSLFTRSQFYTLKNKIWKHFFQFPNSDYIMLVYKNIIKLCSVLRKNVKIYKICMKFSLQSQLQYLLKIVKHIRYQSMIV